MKSDRKPALKILLIEVGHDLSQRITLKEQQADKMNMWYKEGPSLSSPASETP